MRESSGGKPRGAMKVNSTGILFRAGAPVYRYSCIAKLADSERTR